MKRLLLATTIALVFANVHAQQAPGPFAEALVKGHASAPLPNLPDTKRVIELLQKQTKSDGAITAEFWRITKFKSQPNCGRVGMIVVQKSTNTNFPQMVAEMNTCADGTPPLRQCKGQKELVSAETTCADGSPSVDTPEVAAAIAKSQADGGFTAEQVREQISKQAAGAK